MGCVEQAWREAGERFAGLGHELKASYERQGEGEGGTGSASAAADRKALEDGLRRIAGALDHVATIAGATIQDPEVGTAARLASRSLGVAISVTLDEASQELPAAHPRAARRAPGAMAGAVAVPPIPRRSPAA